MTFSTQRTIFSVGLATLALAIAPAAQAQIEVTGGVLNGDAAFFTPDNAADGPISLFDLNISNMQLRSPNGVLTNPDFVPTAAGGFVDTNNNGDIDNGDTGLLVGKLSGIGFDQGGSIVPFSNVTTAVAYRVNAFTNITSTLDGFLVDGASIPQLFFETTTDPLGAGVSGFTSVEGELEVGRLNSKITTGVIDLPSTLTLSSSGGFSSVFDREAFASQFGTSTDRALAEADAEIENDANNDAANIVFNLNTTNITFTSSQTFTVNGVNLFTTTTSSATELDTAKTLIEAILEDLDIENLGSTATLAIFTGGGDNDTVRYEIVNAPSYNVRIKQKRDGSLKIKIKVKNRRGRRYVVALRGEGLIGGFVQNGPSSRAFPGLVGLQPLSDEEAADILALIQADEAAEADGTDDADTDISDSDDAGDDVADDDAGDDVADDDDAGDDVADDGETPDEGAAFEGLDSIDPGESTPGISGDSEGAVFEGLDSITPDEGADTGAIDSDTSDDADATSTPE
ncbi:MAG: hypothetical protein F6J87_16745 [Spirulina sp. SIO3F2]|nr:hypothetical protein [Spirulina sp. SIO3F2]